MPSDIVPDWFNQFLEANTLHVHTETVEVPDSDPIVIEIARGVSWRRTLGLLVVNNLEDAKFRVELARVDGRQRGRIAMAIGNTLRGAARRRGGLYSVGLDGTTRGPWVAAATEWLRPTLQFDYTEPSEDPEGHPLTRGGGSAQS